MGHGVASSAWIAIKNAGSPTIVDLSEIDFLGPQDGAKKNYPGEARPWLWMHVWLMIQASLVGEPVLNV